MEVEKIGELNYKEFKTYFYITGKVKEYLDHYGVSHGSLIPDAWTWYEANLFDRVFDDFGNGYKKVRNINEFKVIYNGLIEVKEVAKGDIKEISHDEKFVENVNGENGEWNFASDSESSMGSFPKEGGKKFCVKYDLYEK